MSSKIKLTLFGFFLLSFLGSKVIAQSFFNYVPTFSKDPASINAGGYIVNNDASTNFAWLALGIPQDKNSGNSNRLKTDRAAYWALGSFDVYPIQQSSALRFKFGQWASEEVPITSIGTYWAFTNSKLISDLKRIDNSMASFDPWGNVSIPGVIYSAGAFISNKNELQFGYTTNIIGTVNTGKIVYQGFSDGLDITGVNGRKIKLWGEGGITITGPLISTLNNGVLPLPNGIDFGYGKTRIVNEGKILYQSTNS